MSAVLRDIGTELEEDSDFNAHILSSLEILGVSEFGDSAVMIKIRIKTRPLKQWMIGRELRRRIKKAFDAQGIEIPFPHMSLYFGEASKPLLTHQLENYNPTTAEHQGAVNPAAATTVRKKATRTADAEAETDGGYE